jgi:hypothetical protein
MIAVYYQSSSAQWKYELEDDEFQNIIESLKAEPLDQAEMFDDALEILRDLSGLEEDEIDEDEEVDQTIAIAYLWQYFNHLATEGERIVGDIAIIEDEDGSGVTIVPAAELLEE